MTAGTADAPETTAESDDPPQTDDAPETTAESDDPAETEDPAESDDPAETDNPPESDDPAEATAETDDPGEIHDPRESDDPAEMAAEAADWTGPRPAIRAPLAEDTPSHSRSAPVPSAPAAPAPVSDAPAQSTPTPRDPGPAAVGPPRPRPEPSWPQVLATTAKLWAERRGRWLRSKGASLRANGTLGPSRGWRLTLIASLFAVLVLAVVTIVLLTRGNAPRVAPVAGDSQSGQHGQGGGGGPVLTAQAVRAQAAGWILAQVSRATIVSCDPVMCSALQARGFPAGNLDVLRPGSADPLDSEVTVATSVLRSQFGSRLTSVYAPVAVAGFGSGSAGVQVRAIAPDGAAAYLRELSADVSARRSFGRQLLGNSHVTTGPAARRQLSRGQVDDRLIVVIGTVAKTHRLRILSFGDAARGASAGVPLRSALLEATTGRSPGTSVLASVRSFLEGQQPPYLPPVARIVRIQDGHYALDVRFALPDPLGLLGTGHSLVTIPSGG